MKRSIIFVAMFVLLSSLLTESHAAAPAVDIIIPNYGPSIGGTSVRIVGANFEVGAKITFGGIAIADVTLNMDGTLLTCTVPSHEPGTVDVTVTNPDGQSAVCTKCYEYYSVAIPTITQITPAYGPSTGGTNVTINGSNFEIGAKVTFDGVEAKNVMNNATEITCTVPQHEPGTVDVKVTNPDGQSTVCTSCYTYVGYCCSTISVMPNYGPSTGGTNVTITGYYNFKIGDKVTFDGIEATDVMISGDAARLICTTPAHAPGRVDVTVTNPDGQSAVCVACYSYSYPPPPTIAAISPNAGPVSGGTFVTIKGINFISDANVSFGSMIVSVVTVSSTEIVCKTPFYNTEGFVDVKITNPDGQSDVCTGCYQYISPKKAIIVAGGGKYAENALWSATRTCTNKAYLSLFSQGYTDDNIYYLSPETSIDATGDGTNDVDADATLQNLENAVKVWAAGSENPADELLIYMTGHSGNETFKLNPTETLDAATLNEWLNELQEKMSGKLIWVYDACMSGSFLPKLKAASGKERYLITGTSTDESAWFIDNGEFSFSSHFWNAVSGTGRLYQSFLKAKEMMKTEQTALADIDGDGAANQMAFNEKGEITADGTPVEDIVIGRGRVSASDSPQIDISPNSTLLNCEIRAKISFTITSGSLSDIYLITARIIHPSYNDDTAEDPVLMLPAVNLTDPDGDGVYECEFDFTEAGEYKISVYSVDKEGYYSVPEIFTVYKKYQCDMTGNGLIDPADAVATIKYLSDASAGSLEKLIRILQILVGLQ